MNAHKAKIGEDIFIFKNTFCGTDGTAACKKKVSVITGSLAV